MGRTVVGAMAFALTVALVGLAGVEAQAAPSGDGAQGVAQGTPEPARMAVVEVIEDGGQGKPHRRRFWLTMTGKRTSRVVLHEEGLDCEIELRKEHDDGRQADLHLTLDHRRTGADRRVRRAQLSVSQRVTIGKPAVMTSIERPGGGQLRVVATLR